MTIRKKLMMYTFIPHYPSNLSPPLVTLPLLGVKTRNVFILILGVGEEVAGYGAVRPISPIRPCDRGG